MLVSDAGFTVIIWRLTSDLPSPPLLFCGDGKLLYYGKMGVY